MKKGAKPAKRSKKSPPKRRAKASKGSPARRAATKRTRPMRPPSSPANREEAEQFVESLRANKQLSEGPGPLPPGATHTLEPDESGVVHVVRKRYSAI